MNKSTLKIQEILNQTGLNLVIKEFPESTRTAQDAANVIGCNIGQIAKSLVFKGKDSGKPILIIASGSNRVSLEKAADFLDEELEKADADFVLKYTGFIIGGVPPFGHSTPLKPLIDQDLLQYDEIWASAGTPNSVFKITSQDLLKITRANAVDIKN